MTGKYYYEQMPSDLQALWLREMVYIGRDVSIVLENNDFESFHKFIGGSFLWKDSTQGQKFWEEIAKENFRVRFSLIEKAEKMLKDIGIDGEQLEELIRKLGMEDQILRQLFLKASQAEVDALVTEKNFLQKIK